MKTFELSSKQNKNGQRAIKVVLHEIFPDSCIDESTQAGTVYNENGITWIEEYCEKALPTLKDKSIRAEFLDDDRTEIYGHGETNYEDGKLLLEDATVVGHFTKGYIDTITMEDGTAKRVCIGEGYIDALCYNNFVKELDADILNGTPPNGSVEIMKTGDNDAIVYKYGYKDEGRIPAEFEYSGYALLGIRPADPASKILELNNSKEESTTMNENEIKELITKVVTDMTNHSAEIEQVKTECEQNIAKANEIAAAAETEKNRVTEEAEGVKSELEASKAQIAALENELNALKEELNEVKIKERKNALESELSAFTDEEKDYAKAEIESFNADPVNTEIESVTNKIWEGIGKNAKKKADNDADNHDHEHNSSHDAFADIFSEVGSSSDDEGIF